ncbi:MAG: hypothetical protein E4G95_01485 [Bacteroidia bacterium]|nr:MAG: hypothetical protein E4G95_01485 [Bacteroidia bacterium]
MKLKIASLLILALSMWECGPSQRITGSWADPEVSSMGPYKKVFVIVLSQQPDVNYNIESQIAKTLITRGFEVVKSNDIFPPKFSVTRDFSLEELVASIKRTGCDAVFTLALLDTKKVESYNPGTAYYPVNYGYYGNYYGYYNYYYPQVYTPGYYSVDKTYYLETNMYDVESTKLIWSIQSEAKNPSGLTDWFKKYSYLIIKHLETSGLSQQK